MQIGIVGAGVAGLSAAIALRKVGHECEVSLYNAAYVLVLTFSRSTRDLSSVMKMEQPFLSLPTAAES